MNSLWRDVRYGIRILFRNPGFSMVAILVTALGIGVNTAIFSVVNAVLFRPLPYEHSERLVKVMSFQTKRGETGDHVSFPNFADYRSQSTTLEALAVFSDRTSVLSDPGPSERIVGLDCSVDLFQVLGTAPLIGKLFDPDDEQKTTSVVLSYGMWKRRFAGDPNIIGHQIILNSQQRTVIGVLPRGFSFPFSNEKPEFFVALNQKGQREIQRGAAFFESIGRVKAGVSLSQAEAELQSIAAHLELQYPEDDDGISVRLSSAHENLVGNLRTTLLVLLSAVGFVLLIACANVANLQLARAMRRSREMSIRLALGASRWRVVRQLLTESLVLSIIGGAAGLLLAMWGIDLMSALVPADIPRIDEARIDPVVLAFTLGTSMLTGVLFGAAPALHILKSDLNDGLKEGGRSATSGRGRSRFRSVLIVSEVGLSLVLMIGAGLLVKSFWKLRYTDPGFASDRVLTASVSLPTSRYPKDEQVTGFYKKALEFAAQQPGVEAAAAILPLPYSENAIATSFTVVGEPDPGPGARPIAGARIISSDYPRAMGIPLLSGRLFDQRDSATASKVILISDALANRFFPDQNPIGRRLLLGLNDIDGEIVGVLKGVRDRNLERDPLPEYYVPFEQVPVNTMSLVIRTSTGDFSGAANVLRGGIQELDKDTPLYRVRPMTSLVANSIARQRFSVTLTIVFAGIALALAALGIFSVMSFLVAQRTHEIGVRMALGAQPGAILRMVVGHGMTLVLAGAAFGLIAAVGLTRLMRELLYQVSPTDALIFVAVPIVIVGVALGACFVPALRATRVDPMNAMRWE